MRLWKKIGLFFVYPAALIAVGFMAHWKIQDYFYQGNSEQEEMYVQIESSSVPETIQETQEAAQLSQTILTCDTIYVVKSHDLKDNSNSLEEEPLPEKYIGMNREQFLAEMELYAKSPSLSDQNKGFVSLNVERFSDKEVVVQKIYESKEKPTEFYLAVVNNYVVVYEKDKKTVYMATGIPLKSLSDDLAREIMQFKYIANEEELYNFLESYSS